MNYFVRSNNLIIVTSEYPPGPGGIGNQAFNLANYFYHINWQVSVLAPARDEFDWQSFDNASEWPVSRYRVSAHEVTKIWKTFIAVNRQRSGGLVILSGQSHLLLALPLRIFFTKKIIQIFHGSELGPKANWKAKIFQFALACAHHRVSVSEFTRSLVKKYSRSLKVDVIPNGINLSLIEKYYKQTAPVKVDQRNLNLITVGSITPRKGQFNVVSALPLLIQTFPDIHYHVVGMDLERAAVEELADALNISNHITIHGSVDDTEKWELLRSSHIFLMLSNNLPDGDVEGFGIAVIEANALGIPAIGSSGTGIAQAIADHISGRLVDAKSPEAVAEAVKDVVENYPSYSQNARDWAKQHDWQLIGEQYLRILTE